MRVVRARIAQFAAIALALLGLAVVAQGPASAAGAPVAHGSAEQLWATGLPASSPVALLSPSGTVVATQNADAQGGVLFRNVTPADGYKIRDTSGATSAPVTVHTSVAAPWDPSIYAQTMKPSGYGYMTMRDGTQLAYAVHLPTAPATLGVGLPSQIENALPNLGLPNTPPYPTLVEYSGYGTATPKGPENGIAVIANLMGFAVVDISMRGTGCSGGAFDFFETMQNLDAYDAIETVANQSWVKGHKVGMLGISYGGISQLFAAQYNPPSLAAIAPLSVIASVPTTLFPGGYLNTGFALNWALERVHDSKPSSATTGQPWAWAQIQAGDTTCAANQALHGEALDLLAKIRANSQYYPAAADPLDPVSFVDKIKVPVFMACQWEDEQTGGYCPVLERHMTGTTKKWFTYTNGVHGDSLDPATLNKMFDFFELYVNGPGALGENPALVNSGLLKATAPLILQQAFGLPQSDVVTLPNDPIQTMPTYAAALAAFDATPEVTVRFDNGAGSSTAGDPVPSYEHTYSALPIPGTQIATWFLGAGGTLNSAAPAAPAVTGFTADAKATSATDYTGNTGSGGLWGNASQWTWNWQQPPAKGTAPLANNAVSFITDPLAQNTTVIGSGAVYLYAKSSTPDVDLMVTVSEVRPDGNETYVQSGYLRASDRVLDYSSTSVMKQPSTELEPVQSLRPADVHPMPAGQFTPIAVPLYYQGHAYRAGSKIRVTVSAPNGNQPVWAFAETNPGSPSQVSLALGPVGANTPSRLVLPVIPDQTIATGYPACPSLRNQPCRTYAAAPNPVLTEAVSLVPMPPSVDTAKPSPVSTVAPASPASQNSLVPTVIDSGRAGGRGSEPLIATGSALLVTGAGFGLFVYRRFLVARG